MKKYIISLLLIILVLIGIPFAALASDISGAKWYGVITVSNNGSTANTNVATVFTLNTTPMVALGYMYSSGNNTAIVAAAGADVAYMPGYAGNVWGLFVPSIAAETYTSDVLYTGGTDNMDSKIRYFPGATGMTTSDDPSLELSDNFTIELNGFVDTTYTANKTILDKRDAIGKGFWAYISGTGNITGTISGYEDFLRYTEVDANGKLTVTKTTATGVDVDSDESVYLYRDMGADHFDALDIDFDTLIAAASLDTGRVGIAVTNTVGTITDFAATDMTVYTNRSGADYRVTLTRGADVATDFYTGAADTPYYCTLKRVAGNDTVTVEIYATAARASALDTLTLAGFGATKYRYIYSAVNNNSGAGGQDWDGYIQNIDLGADSSVTASGVASGEHTVIVGIERR